MLETRQLHPTLAREVVGLRLWERLDDATVAELRILYGQYGVMVFRRQAVSEAELAAFCALFGPLERTVRSDWASPAIPEVTVVSNLKDGLGRPIGGLGDGELQWHSDQSYMLQPATGATLYAGELPAEGDETFWVDLRAAYAGLPRQLRATIAGKRGIFDYTRRLAGYGREADQQISEEARRLTPPVTHALVRAHQWQVGDLVLWDNGFTMHRRTPFDPGARRLMKRMTMKLDRYHHVLPDGRLAQSEVGMPI
jgi:taurine dioxygenase